MLARRPAAEVLAHHQDGGAGEAAVVERVVALGLRAIVLDVRARTLTSRAGTFACEIPEGACRQLVEGTWNATAVLLEAGDRIEATARRLPYVSGYAG